MASNEYDRFVKELTALREFRRLYNEMHPSLSIPESDPHTTLIIESMAVYAARTAQMIEDNQQRRYSTLMWQYFPYLMKDLPLGGVLQAIPTTSSVEPVDIDRHELFQIQGDAGRSALVRTLASVTVAPIAIEKVELRPSPTGGPRVAVVLRSLQFQTWVGV